MLIATYGVTNAATVDTYFHARLSTAELDSATLPRHSSTTSGETR